MTAAARPSKAADTASGAATRAPWRWAVAGAVLGALLALLLAAPARWLGALLSHASGGAVQLLDAEGSVWRGSARLEFTGGAGSRDRAALPGRLHWRLTPGPGALHASVQAQCCTPHGAIALAITPRWGGAHIAVREGHSEWPAALLTGLGTPFNTLQLHGTLLLLTQPLSLDIAQGRVRVEGSASLTAQRISSRLSPLPALGSYRVQLAGGAAPSLRLQTLEGALHLSGSGQWSGGRLRFAGEASAAEGMEAPLANLLNVIGQRRGNKALINFS